MKEQAGFINTAIVTFLVILTVMLYPWKFTIFNPDECRVGDAVIPENERSVMLPPIKNVGLPRLGYQGGWDENSPPVEYVLIRRNVPIFTHTEDPAYVIGYPDYMGRDGAAPGKLKWAIIADVDFLGRHADTRHTLKYPGANQSGFDVYYPNDFGEVEIPWTITDRTGASSNILTLRTEGFLMFVHLGDDGKPVKVYYGKHIYYIVDFYQLKSLYQTPVAEKGYQVDDMFHCIDPEAPQNLTFMEPAQNTSHTNGQLQLEWFVIKGAPGMYAHCKPAIYLYPERKQLINVKVVPRGELSYTDPAYDKSVGWNVEAVPEGVLTTTFNQQPKTYPYLYYESKIWDYEIKKPSKGWVVKSDELVPLFERILPMLGLNTKEKNDFIKYWQTALPISTYYFVGLVDKSQRDYLEPLVVNPEPDTSIRFSLYFEPINKKIDVIAPQIETPQRVGFTLVDWGGMIKNDHEHSFTCSQ